MSASVTVSALQDKALEVCAWLDTMPRTYAAPVVVRIGRRLYAGATFTQIRETGEGTPAYAAGERGYCHSGMYLLGEKPYAYRRRSATAFRIPGARWPWFVAGWYEKAEPNEWYPFGQMFLLQLDKQGICVDNDGQPYRETRLDLIG